MPDRLAEAHERIHALEAEVRQATQTARETYAALATVEHERDTANAANEALRQENKALTYQRDTAREALADTERALDHTEAQLATARQERDAYHDRIVSARAKLHPFA